MERYHGRLWWALLAALVVACVAATVVAQAHARGAPAGGPTTQFRVLGQYVLGTHLLFGRAAGGQEALKRARAEARTTADRLRLLPLAGEISGPDAVREGIARLREGPLTDAQREDVDLIERLYGGGVPTPEEEERLARRHGWFGRLALVHGRDRKDPERSAVLARARWTAIVSFAASVGAIAAFAVGLGLFLVALVLRHGGRLRAAYVPPPAAARDTVYVETVALLLAGVLLLALLPAVLPAAHRFSYLLVWPLALIPLWPLARGVKMAEWRASLGLVRGRGLLREAGAGLLGYLAGLPIVALGIGASLLLAKWTGQEMTHPVFEDVQEGGSAWALAFVAACVWAPFVEETVFRGALYRYLRSRTSALVSAALVGFMFAVVHPQGLAGTPMLMSLGFVFALVREWRGSLVGCIVAHACHNAVLMAVVSVLFA